MSAVDRPVEGAASRPGVEGERLETDYLIVGAGAMGMAFADVVLTEDPSAHVVLVDRRAGPGGHWNDAYPFVTLHQPSTFYGLNSAELGRGGRHLASGAEVVAYYQAAMDRFVESAGRVRFLGLCEYTGDGRVVSLVDPDRVVEVTARRRVVDGTYSEVRIPATSAPRYTVDAGVDLVPPGELARLRRPSERYVVVGAGKTAIDVVLFLLDRGVRPDRIRWIRSHDAWLWARESVQPGLALRTVRTMLHGLTTRRDVDDVFLDLERRGITYRIDTDRTPTVWRCAVVSREELTQLRRVHDVVRRGRVRRIRADGVDLDDGTLTVDDDTLFVDCTANGLGRRPATAVFTPGRVTLQSVFMCQQVFSAALIAHLELKDADDDRRNRTAVPVPHPEQPQDLADGLVTSARNMVRSNLFLPVWLRRSRLYLGAHEAFAPYLVASARIALTLSRLARRRG